MSSPLKGGGGKTTVTTWLGGRADARPQVAGLHSRPDHALSKVMGRFGHPNKTSGTAWTILHAIEHIYGLAQKGQQITKPKIFSVIHGQMKQPVPPFFEGPEAETV